MLAVIVNRCHLMQADTCLVEALSHPSGVGIHHLTNEQLIAYRNNLCFHMHKYKIARKVVQTLSPMRVH